MKTNKYTDFQLEQFLLKELPAEVMESISRDIETDAPLRARIDELKNSDIEILKKYPADLISGKIINRIRIEKENSAGASATAGDSTSNGRMQIPPLRKLTGFLHGRAAYSLAAALAASAAVIVFVVISPKFTGTIPAIKDNDVVRIKGMEPGISIHRKKGSVIEELKNMDKTSQGDLLQIGYISTGEYKHGVILSVDGRGAVTLHHPESESGDTLIKVNRKVMLKRSYELDDSPGFEKFILVLSEKQIDVKTVIERAKIVAQSRESVFNDRLTADGRSMEFSLTVKK